MANKVVVVGLGRFGASVAKTLYDLGHDVLAIDKTEKVVQDVLANVTFAVTLDATDEATLRQVGVPAYGYAVVGIGKDVETSVIVTMLLKQRLGVPVVVSRARNETHGDLLARVGADKVIYPAQESGIRVAHTLFYPSVKDYLELVQNYGVSKVTVPDSMLGKSLTEARLELKDKHSLGVLAIGRGNDIVVMPDHSERLRFGDVLLVIGEDEQLERLHEKEEPRATQKREA